MFKVNIKNPSVKCGICWKLTRKTLERLADVVQLLLSETYLIFCSTVSAADFEQVNAGCQNSIESCAEH